MIDVNFVEFRVFGNFSRNRLAGDELSPGDTCNFACFSRFLIGTAWRWA